MSTWKSAYRKRLEKLAIHLEKGKLGHDKFRFDTWHRVNCESSGCAIGECTTIWPRHFRFGSFVERVDGSKVAYVHLGDTAIRNERAAKKFFGLDPNEAEHLFLPNCQNVCLYGGKDLGDNATRKQVASNIREFIKRKVQQ